MSDELEQPRTVGAEVFAKLRAMWGTRFLALWRGTKNLDEVLSTWDEALADIDPERIQRALVDSRNAENPPTLPEFLRLCRTQPAANDRQPRLPYCGAETSAEQARENLERTRRMFGSIGQAGRRDPLSWARHPRSAQSIQALAQGAATDPRLRTILLEHVDEGGTRCRSDEATKALLALMQAGVVDRLRGIVDVPAYDPEHEPAVARAGAFAEHRA